MTPHSILLQHSSTRMRCSSIEGFARPRGAGTRYLTGTDASVAAQAKCRHRRTDAPAPQLERQVFSMLSSPYRHRSLCVWLYPCFVTVFLSSALSVAASAAELTLSQALHAGNRTPAMIARDPARHPVEELSFFGVTPRSSVIEIWPGSGYWTEILAPYLYDRGRYTLAVDVPNGELEGNNFALGLKFAARLDADPVAYGHISYEFFGAKHPDPAPAGSADVVLTFRNLHNWVNQGDAEILLAGIHRALKPGGILGIEDHRGNPHLPQDAKARFGYLRQDYAIALVERAGFKLVATSEIDANPRDTADYPHGVWTLPPTLARGAQDRARYEAIGEADNFVLKFCRVN